MRSQGRIAPKAGESRWVSLELSVAGTTATATVNGAVAHATLTHLGGAASGMVAVVSGWNVALFDNFHLEASK